MIKVKGIIIAVIILAAWAILTYCGFVYISNPFTWSGFIMMVLLTHAYTGLFITAHDGMHGTIANHKFLNKAIGTFCLAIHAFNNFSKMLPKHHEHHRFVATENDPDYHASGNFIIWYLSFIKTYISWFQIIAIAITYNILKIYFKESLILTYYIIPMVLSTFQLFYFGTYLPHKNAPNNKHSSNTQAKSHIWAFLSCYFFGYHYEHHDQPYLPWWQLYKTKN